MSAVKDRVNVTGLLEYRPVLKIVSSNKNLTKISILTKELIHDDNRNWVAVTKRHKLTLWGRQALLATQHLERGSEVSLEGRFVNAIYMDEEGLPQYFTDVEITKIYVFKNGDKIKLRNKLRGHETKSV